MKRFALYFFFCCAAAGSAVFAQTPDAETAQAPDTAQRENGVGAPLFHVPGCVVYAEWPSEEAKARYYAQLREYERLRRNIMIVYPLAKECSRVINQVNADLADAPQGDRKKYLRKLEKELFEKHEDRIRKLTLTQGKLLIKLIDRECGSSAFTLIDEYKSWRSATLWQLVATFFGANLKSDYDPKKEPAIEHIVREIESGRANSYSITYSR